jgi:predicted metal-dependent hydrolase
MRIKKLSLARPADPVEVIIERKRIRSVRLKVYPNGVVKLSAPFGVPDGWIDDYLAGKAPWIARALDYFEGARVSEVAARIKSGVTTRILGRQVRFIVEEANFYKIEQRGDHVYIWSPAAGDTRALKKQFERWLQKQSRPYFLAAIDRWYPVIARYGIARPALQVRRMRTLWGSSSGKQGRINLNCFLYKAPPPCIDYVVLHELAHLLHPGHDRDFYAFLTMHMPDWKERKRVLDHEVVKGLGY